MSSPHAPSAESAAAPNQSARKRLSGGARRKKQRAAKAAASVISPLSSEGVQRVDEEHSVLLHKALGLPHPENFPGYVAPSPGCKPATMPPKTIAELPRLWIGVHADMDDGERMDQFLAWLVSKGYSSYIISDPSDDPYENQLAIQGQEDKLIHLRLQFEMELEQRITSL